MPAEFTSVVTPANRRSVASIIRAQAPASVTSTSSASASPPALAIAVAVFSARAATRSTHATPAPSVASRSAVARPMPDPAPVTTAVLPRMRMTPPPFRPESTGPKPARREYNPGGDQARGRADDARYGDAGSTPLALAGAP